MTPKKTAAEIYCEDFYSAEDDWERCDFCGKEYCECDECGQMPDGTCTLAGTEHCDFECPFRDG